VTRGTRHSIDKFGFLGALNDPDMQEELRKIKNKKQKKKIEDQKKALKKKKPSKIKRLFCYFCRSKK
jgi:hypothetical protein